MANSRVKERFELAMDARQVIAVLVGSLVILGGVFVLGITVGRQQAPAAPTAAAVAPRDALARLDDPLPAREEPPPVLKAHQALTDGRAIEKALPVPQVKTTTVAIAPAGPVAPPVPPASDPVIQPIPAPAAAAVAVRAATSPAVASPSASAGATRRDSRHDAKARQGAYTVQVASVPHRADAERLARRLAGRNPRVVAAEIPGKGRWYRVLVGSFDTQDAARRQVAALGRSGVHGIVTAMR